MHSINHPSIQFLYDHSNGLNCSKLTVEVHSQRFQLCRSISAMKLMPQTANEELRELNGNRNSRKHEFRSYFIFSIHIHFDLFVNWSLFLHQQQLLLHLMAVRNEFCGIRCNGNNKKSNGLLGKLHAAASLNEKHKM